MPRQCEILVLVTAILGVLLFVFPVCAQSRAPDSPTADHAIALEVGKPVEREIGGGATHRYSIRLEPGQLLDATVEQKGVDVEVVLLDSDGKTVLAVDSPNGANGPEPVLFVAETGDVITLVIRTLEPAQNSGRYEARINEIRTATEKDRQLGEATRLFGQSVLLSSAGESGSAILAGERALTLYEQVLGLDHRDIATPLNSLGALYRNHGDYAKAEPLFARSLAIREREYGLDHVTVAESLSNLALLYKLRGLYAKAEPLYARSLAIYEKALGPDSPIVATVAINMAGLYRDQGAYAKAEALLERALAIRQKALGPNHPEVAGCLNNLAVVYRDQGAFAKAEPLYTRSLAIFEKALRPDHPHLAMSLNNLASLYQDQGSYAKAEPLFVRALAINEKALGPDHRDVALSLNNLAALYQVQGDFERAEPLYVRSLAIREKVLGPDHPDVAYSLSNLAALYQDQGDYAKAEPLNERALAIREKALGPEHPDVAASLNNLAGLYQYQGNYLKAVPLYARALAIWVKAFGPDHPLVARLLNNLALLCLAVGSVDQSVEFQARANEARERELAVNLAWGSERSKLQYLEVTADELYRTVSLHVQSAPANPEARRNALEIILRRKGRGLDVMTDQIAAVRRLASPEDQALLDELALARSELSRRTLAGPGNAGAEAHRFLLDELDKRVEALEGRIAERSSQFRAVSQRVSLDTVAKAISAGASLVEFAVYCPFDPKPAAGKKYGSPRYVVYVLGRDVDPRWADLGEAAAIDAAVGKLREALRDPKRRDVKRLARELDELVMRPVRGRAGSTRHLLVAPDGALNLVPFAALVDERGRYLVETYELTNLTSGRDLLRIGAGAQPREKPLVVADPDYGDMSLARGSGTRAIVQKQAQSGAASVDFGDIGFPPLANTEAEAREVGALLVGSRVLTGDEATEVALKSAHAPEVLHVATHGFFLPDLEIRPAAGAADRGFGSTDLAQAFAGVKIENPLLRSGLALAGANARKSGEDDGILTASEVAGLDLWGTKLVVLSACQTGVGEVRAGDGVYGLRRALLLAGSESQVMSLWRVADRETRELMRAFYTRLRAGDGRTAALRKVQLAMLRNPRTRHPFYWAAFIQSGAWGPLE